MPLDNRIELHPFYRTTKMRYVILEIDLPGYRGDSLSHPHILDAKPDTRAEDFVNDGFHLAPFSIIHHGRQAFPDDITLKPINVVLLLWRHNQIATGVWPLSLSTENDPTHLRPLPKVTVRISTAPSSIRSSG